MDDLIRLPNGRWIDPIDVRGVMPMDAAQWDNGDVLPRVRIDLRGNDMTLIECADYQGAIAFAEEIATKANAARRLTRMVKIDG